MRLFGGLSIRGPGHSRFGISRRGRPWAGIRAERIGPVYAGALVSGGSTPHRSSFVVEEASVAGVTFRVYHGGIVTVDGKVVRRKDLRAVLTAADAAAR